MVDRRSTERTRLVKRGCIRGEFCGGVFPDDRSICPEAASATVLVFPCASTILSSFICGGRYPSSSSSSIASHALSRRPGSVSRCIPPLQPQAHSLSTSKLTSACSSPQAVLPSIPSSSPLQLHKMIVRNGLHPSANSAPRPLASSIRAAVPELGSLMTLDNSTGQFRHQ